MNYGSLPPSLVFVFTAIVAALLGVSIYDCHRTRTIPYVKRYPRVVRHRGAWPDIKWHMKAVPRRRDKEPFQYWLGMSLMGFGFVFCTLGAAAMLFLTIVNW